MAMQGDKAVRQKQGDPTEHFTHNNQRDKGGTKETVVKIMDTLPVVEMRELLLIGTENYGRGRVIS